MVMIYMQLCEGVSNQWNISGEMELGYWCHFCICLSDVPDGWFIDLAINVHMHT